VCDQAQRKLVKDAPIAALQSIGHGGAARHGADAHVKQLAAIGSERGFDVAQRLTPTELREGQNAKQLRAAQPTNPAITLVSFDDAAEGLPRYKLHHLRKQRLALVHAGLWLD
jgi:hypothetical protein